MLPGKKYTSDDVLSLLRRRAWLIVVLLVVGTAAGTLVYQRLPRWYRSETVIMLMAQRIPDAYVKATSTDKIEDRLSTLEDQILSRSRLERIIDEQNLYADLRGKQPLETLVARMRKEITVKVEGKDTFRLIYIGRDAETVQRVTARLASLFIEENLRDRGKQTQDTNDFLDSQLQDARRRLVEHEKKLEAYRREHSGQLPSQAASNLQAIQNLQMQIQALDAATDRATERRLLLERQIADAEAAGPVALPAAQAEAAGVPVTTGAALEAARVRLRDLLTHAKPDHPDVQAAQRAVRDLEAKQTAESTAAGPSGRPVQDALSPAEAQRQNRSRELRAELDVLDQQARARQAQEKRLRDEVAAYQAKLDSVPSRESDLDELTRDYRTLQATYEGLLVKREDARLASDLERRNIGQQFKVLDQAGLPERPFSPKRILVLGGGAGGGVALALLILGLLEYRDDSFTREEEVVRLCQVPVLALVPTLTSVVKRDRARRRTQALLAATVVALLASVAAALAVWQGLLRLPRG
jgi:polysaccharide chain length determinant protein (PEP-CTERM system associated)